MLSSKRKRQPSIHAIKLSLDLPGLDGPATQSALSTDIIKFLLINRGLSPGTIEELHKVLVHHEALAQAKVQAAVQAGKPHRRMPRPPSAFKKVQQLLASTNQLTSSLEQQLHVSGNVGTGFKASRSNTLAISLGTTPSRAREVYFIHFPVKAWSADASTSAPAPKQMAAAQRQLVRCLLQQYASIPAWESLLPGGTKLHLLAQAPGPEEPTDNVGFGPATHANSLTLSKSTAHDLSKCQMPQLQPQAHGKDGVLGGMWGSWLPAPAPAVYLPRPHLTKVLDYTQPNGTCTIPVQVHITITAKPPASTFQQLPRQPSMYQQPPVSSPAGNTPQPAIATSAHFSSQEVTLARLSCATAALSLRDACGSYAGPASTAANKENQCLQQVQLPADADACQMHIQQYSQDAVKSISTTSPHGTACGTRSDDAGGDNMQRGDSAIAPELGMLCCVTKQAHVSASQAAANTLCSAPSQPDFTPSNEAPSSQQQGTDKCHMLCLGMVSSTPPGEPSAPVQTAYNSLERMLPNMGQAQAAYSSHNMEDILPNTSQAPQAEQPLATAMEVDEHGDRDKHDHADLCADLHEGPHGDHHSRDVVDARDCSFSIPVVTAAVPFVIPSVAAVQVAGQHNDMPAQSAVNDAAAAAAAAQPKAQRMLWWQCSVCIKGLRQPDVQGGG